MKEHGSTVVNTQCSAGKNPSPKSTSTLGCLARQFLSIKKQGWDSGGWTAAFESCSTGGIRTTSHRLCKRIWKIAQILLVNMSFDILSIFFLSLEKDRCCLKLVRQGSSYLCTAWVPSPLPLGLSETIGLPTPLEKGP